MKNKYKYIVLGAVVVLLAVALYYILIPRPLQAVIVEPKPLSDGTYQVIANKSVTFIGQAQDERGNIIEQGVEYSWDIDGEKLDWAEGNNSITHAFQERGKYYTVKLMVRRRGATGKLTEKQIAQLKVYVNLPPVAQAFVSSPEPDFRDNQGAVPLRIEFDGSRSSDSDGRIVSWLWNFGDGQTSNEQNPSHRYDREGHYNIKLTVMDNMGEQGEAAISITVVPNQPPTGVAIEVIGLKDGRVPRREVSFQGKAIDPEGRALQFLWNFGDKGTSTEQNPTHKYADGGNYAVRLSVADDYNKPISVERSIYVNKPPVPIPSVTQAPDENQLTILFDASKSYDPDPSPSNCALTYGWDFGDRRGVSNKSSGSYSYDASGTYTVRLTISDCEGESSWKETIAHVQGLSLEGLLRDRISKGLIEATLKDLYISPKGKVHIIIFEDMHRTSLIQQRTARSLIALSDIIDTIGVEGASQPLDLSFFISDLKRVEGMDELLPAIAWAWLSSNCIGATEHFALALGKGSILEPVEDEFAYQAHGNCLKKARYANECKHFRDARDKVIAEKLVNALLKSQNSGMKVGVLVIGAAHVVPDGIIKELKSLGSASYYILSPLDLDKCIQSPADCGVVSDKEYLQICSLIRGDPPLEKLFKELSTVWPPDPNKYGAASKDFKENSRKHISWALAIHYLTQGYRVDEIQKKFARHASLGIHFPETLVGLSLESKFERIHQVGGGLTLREKYLYFKGSKNQSALIKLPDAYFTNQGFVRFPTDIRWDTSLNDQVEDLLTLPQNGLARADLFAALRTPGAAQTWEWQRADGSWVYARLSKSKRIEDGAEKEVGTITQITRDEYQKDLVTRLQPLLEMIEDKTTRNNLETNFNALRKLDAWARYPIYPQILVLQVDNRLLLAIRKGEQQEVEVKEVDPKSSLIRLIDSIEQRIREHPSIPFALQEKYGIDYARYVVNELLTEAERKLIKDQLVLPLVQHLNPHIEGDRIILDLRGRPFALRDIPPHPVLRTLIPYFLRGNRLVYVAPSSTAREVEVKLQVKVDYTKLKFFVSLPTDFVKTHGEVWQAEIEKLKKNIKDKLKVDPDEFLKDLTYHDSTQAEQILMEALTQEDSMVFAFGHHLETGELEIGQSGRFSQGKIPRQAPKSERFVAFTGCASDVPRAKSAPWSDTVVEKLGVLSFSFYEAFSAAEQLRFLNAIVDELAKDLNARPPAILFFLDIMEKLKLEKGGPVVHIPYEQGKG